MVSLKGEGKAVPISSAAAPDVDGEPGQVEGEIVCDDQGRGLVGVRAEDLLNKRLAAHEVQLGTRAGYHAGPVRAHVVLQAGETRGVPLREVVAIDQPLLVAAQASVGRAATDLVTPEEQGLLEVDSRFRVEHEDELGGLGTCGLAPALVAPLARRDGLHMRAQRHGQRHLRRTEPIRSMAG